MGSCISKCRFCGRCPEETGHVQDKLVISQAPATPTPPPPPLPPLPPVPEKVSPYPPPSPPPSSSSSSSLSCSSSKQTCCSSSSSGSSSSVPYSKDRVLFSNEFLWSCYQENPHVLRMNSLKETASSSTTLKPQKLASLPQKSVSQGLHNSQTPQKRLRPSSPAPALTRQKSFRKEQPGKDIPLWPSHLPNRTMRSPSPSRRFNGGVRESYSSRQMVGSSSSSSRKENLIPGYHQSRPRSNAMNKATCVHRINSKINERAVREALSNHDVNSITPEVDMENPLISLDCFIFV